MVNNFTKINKMNTILSQDEQYSLTLNHRTQNYKLAPYPRTILSKVKAADAMFFPMFLKYF